MALSEQWNQWSDSLPRLRARLHERQPVLVILCGPASVEDRLYYSRTSVGRRSSDELAAELGRIGLDDVRVVDVTTTPRWFDELDDADLVIINLHGSPGEDGAVQGLLRSRSIPFLGSGVEASVVALNKVASKLFAREAGVPTPAFARRRATRAALVQDLEPSPRDLPTGDGGRSVWKPVHGGSSLDVFLLPAGEQPSADGDWLVEEFIDGQDVTVAVIGGSSCAVPLPAVALRHPDAIYDVDTKIPLRLEDRAVASRPPELVGALRQCEVYALRMHQSIGAAHLSRCDFVVRDGKPWFLEINTMPGISSLSNVADCARAAGLGHPELLTLLVGWAIGEDGAPRRPR